MVTPLPLSRIDAMRAAARKIVRELGFMRKGLAGTDLSPSGVHTIIELGYGTVSQARDLAEALHLEKSSVSRLVQKLEQDGLIAVASDTVDKRARLLSLTERGRAVFAEVEAFGRQQMQAALAALPHRDVAQIETGLQLFATALRNGETTEGPGPGVEIHDGYRPGVIAAVTHLHATYYAEHYQFGAVFERKVATEMAAFMERIERPVNTTISAYRGAELLGSVTIDGEDLGTGQGHLRWFIVSPRSQGMGIGRLLLARAMSFADQQGFDRTRLWTFRGLDAARALYEAHGFQLVHETPGRQWGTEVIEQEFVRDRPA